MEAVPYADKELASFRTNRGDDFRAGIKRILKIDRSDFMCDEIFEVTLDTGDMLPYMEIVHRASFRDEPVVQITISPERNNMAYTVQILLTDDGKMAEYLPNPHKKSVYHDEITIDGKAYSNVIEILYIKPYTKSIAQLFYNKAFGVIQYTTEDGLVVTRQ